MRKLCLAILVIALMLLASSALADTFAFNDIRMALELPAGVYETQLTPENLAANEAFLTAQGTTAEKMAETFKAEGILLMAYDTDNDRVFVVTALADEWGKKYFNINEQTPETRATYRSGHANGTYCGALGYKFESCEWKNFGDEQGRFLMLKYVLRKDNAVAWRGLWRRTIRNGYTITLDMRVQGRQVKGADITALNKIQDSVTFSADISASDSPMPMIVTAAPPEETNSASFTVKGSAKPGASVTAVLTSFSSTQSIIFTAAVNNTGKFTLPITLPREDYYYMALASEYAGEIESQIDYTITYDDQLLPVNLTSDFPIVFTSDSFKFTGTTLSGVKVQMVVNGKAVTKTTGNNKTFSFTVDTSEEIPYNIEVTFTKKNYNTRLLTYTILRDMTPEERQAKTRADAIAPTYAKLKSSLDGYTGRIVHYTGYIQEIRQVTDTEWSIAFALKYANGAYSDIIMLTASQAPEFSVDTHLTFYGTVKGGYMALEDGKDVSYPLCALLFFDAT